MSAITSFAVLALASSVFAVPYAGHGHHAAHQNAHRRAIQPAAYGAPSYPMSNGTSSSSSSELSPQSPTLIPSGYVSSSSEAAAIPTTAQSSANGLPSVYGSASTDVTTTSIIHTTSTTTSYTTVYLSRASSSAASAQAPASSSVASSSEADSISPTTYEAKEAALNTGSSNAASPTDEEQCAAVTVTATEKVTQYITVSPSSSAAAPVADTSSAPATSALYSAANTTSYAPTAYSSASYSIPAPSSNSSEAGAIPATTSSAVAYSAPAYSTPSSSEAAAISTSAPSAPAYSVPSSSEAAAVATSGSSTTSAAAIVATSYENKGLADDLTASSTLAAATYSSAASSTASASASSTASSTGGKRGLAYNDAALTDCFTGGSEITWAYNWGSSAGDLASGLSFIPTLWGTSSDFTSDWSSNAKSAISSGSTTLFSFNEPDIPSQSNLTPEAAAAAYKTYMEPLGSSAKLCAPAVTNSGTAGEGLSWLSQFLECCTDCQIDCINIHWYDSAENTDYFKSHVENATSIANGKPVYVSEFGATGSDDQITSFLEDVMPWMDSNSAIGGYAYFMVENGVLVTGTEPSTYGSVYKSYT